MKSDHSHYTTPVSEIERSDCESLIRIAISEDSPAGDPTSEAIFPENEMGAGYIVSREPGILCGMPVIEHLIDIYHEMGGKQLQIEPFLKDRDQFEENQEILRIRGPIRDILRMERLILNFLQYLSSISSTVHNAVIKGKPDLMIVDTRKTIPGYRKLAKYAVNCGGGVNHRINLSDMILIKDNHIAASGGITGAVEKIRSSFPDLPLEVEVDTLEQLRETVSLEPDYVLLDNMGRAEIQEAISIISQLPEHRRPKIEISGGWTPDRFDELKGLGSLRISMSYLTATTRFLDLSLEYR